MCGIVGLFLKDRALEPELGALLARMLGTLCDRGPDSAGFAVYGAAVPGAIKLTIRGPRALRLRRRRAPPPGRRPGAAIRRARHASHPHRAGGTGSRRARATLPPCRN